MPWKKKPCGHRYCAAAYRIVWAQEDWTLDQCAKAIGLAKGSIHRAGEMLDLPPRPRAKPPKRVSRRAVEAAWNGKYRTLNQAAASIGVSAHVLRYQAMTIYGLPARKWTNHATAESCRWFREMWLYDVSVASRAEHMGRCETTVERIASRLGLEPRNRHRATRKPTVAEFIRDELPRILLAREAKVAGLTRVLRSGEHGTAVPASVIKQATKILVERRAA